MILESIFLAVNPLRGVVFIFVFGMSLLFANCQYRRDYKYQPEINTKIPVFLPLKNTGFEPSKWLQKCVFFGRFAADFTPLRSSVFFHKIFVVKKMREKQSYLQELVRHQERRRGLETYRIWNGVNKFQLTISLVVSFGYSLKNCSSINSAHYYDWNEYFDDTIPVFFYVFKCSQTLHNLQINSAAGEKIMHFYIQKRISLQILSNISQW